MAQTVSQPAVYANGLKLFVLWGLYQTHTNQHYYTRRNPKDHHHLTNNCCLKPENLHCVIRTIYLTQCNIQRDLNLQQHYCKNLISHMIWAYSSFYKYERIPNISVNILLMYSLSFLISRVMVARYHLFTDSKTFTNNSFSIFSVTYSVMNFINM